MAIRWEVSKVRTKTEELMAEIMLLPQPVGIVLLGDDCEFKNEIVGKVFQNMRSESFLGHVSRCNNWQYHKCF